MTLSTRGWVALPFDENDNIATAGSSPANRVNVAADEIATAASWSAVGSGSTPQSP